MHLYVFLGYLLSDKIKLIGGISDCAIGLSERVRPGILIPFLSLFSYWQLTWFSFSVVPQLDFSSLIGFLTANDAAGVKLKLLAPSNDSSVSWQMPFGPQSTAHVLISQLFPLQPDLQEQKPDGKQDLAFIRFIQEQRLQSEPSNPVLHWQTPLNVIYSSYFKHWLISEFFPRKFSKGSEIKVPKNLDRGFSKNFRMLNLLGKKSGYNH